MAELPLALNLDDHQPSLRQIADRLLVIAQTLIQEHGIPHELAEELATASTRCAHAYDHLESALTGLDHCRDQLENWLDFEIARLRQECPRSKGDGLDHLRPDAQGSYAWDRWQARALEAGLGQDLASLGRAVMREAVQHSWAPALKIECGWADAGQAMLALALRAGVAAEKRWRYLLETDGLRDRWTADGEWQSFAEDGL